MHEYGIKQEMSDVRIHVSAVTNLAYYYKTEDMKSYIKDKDFREVVGPTFVGLLVPIDAPFVKSTYYKPAYRGLLKGRTKEKGEGAELIALHLLITGRIPITGPYKQIKNKKQQIDGIDILAGDTRIQVKCDKNAAPKPMGSNNLFIQTHERRV